MAPTTNCLPHQIPDALVPCRYCKVVQGRYCIFKFRFKLVRPRCRVCKLARPCCFVHKVVQLAFANVVASSYLTAMPLRSPTHMASPLISNMQLVSWMIDVFSIGITNSVDTISIVGCCHQCYGQNSPAANENIIFLNQSWMGLEISDCFSTMFKCQIQQARRQISS